MGLLFELARRERELPEDFDAPRLTQAARRVLEQVPDAAAWGQGSELDEIHPLDEEILGDFLGGEPISEARFMARRALLEALARPGSARQRRRAASSVLLEHLDELLGWAQMIDQGTMYQLGAQAPWWRDGGGFFLDEREREQLVDRDRLEREGFYQISRADYARHARFPILMDLLRKRPSQLDPLATLVALLTAEVDEPGAFTHWATMVTFDLANTCMGALQRQMDRALYNPPHPIVPRDGGRLTFSLATQQQLLDAKVEGLPVDPGVDGLHVRHHDQEHPLVEVTMEAGRVELYGSLIKGIEALGVAADQLEHLPRVCAGMLVAARQDRDLDFSYEGTFWDTAHGHRLCRIVGFDEEDQAHLERVQRARGALEGMVLCRGFARRDRSGRRMRVRWSGPLLELRRARMELSIEDRFGLSEHHTLFSWSLADELWSMLRSVEGGVEVSLSWLDARAFGLDVRTGHAFNLYLALACAPGAQAQEGEVSFEVGQLLRWISPPWGGEGGGRRGALARLARGHGARRGAALLELRAAARARSGAPDGRGAPASVLTARDLRPPPPAGELSRHRV